MGKTINDIKKAYEAGSSIRAVKEKDLKRLLKRMAQLLVENQKVLLKANQVDLEQLGDNPKADRLLLNATRIHAIAKSIKKVASLPSPVNKVLEKRTLENGLLLEKLSVPLGVVGAVYESRPNVTFDISALCIRSGNAVVLKGSKDAWATNKAAVAIIHKALKEFELPTAIVTLLGAEREVVSELLSAKQYVDVVIPRGSAGLIDFVRQNSQIPVIETGAGVCHIYVEQKANIEKALRIVVNAKTSRPSVCNAMDTLLVDEKIAGSFLKKLQPLLAEHKVEIFAGEDALIKLKHYPYLKKAKKSDYAREFLDLKCAVKVVKNTDDALKHISTYSTKHSEAIVTEDKAVANLFIREVDAAAVYHNASTRFTDGEVFGLGAEIGISTQKLHARGPFALEKLVTEKWVLRGSGQIR